MTTPTLVGGLLFSISIHGNCSNKWYGGIQGLSNAEARGRRVSFWPAAPVIHTHPLSLVSSLAKVS